MPLILGVFIPSLHVQQHSLEKNCKFPRYESSHLGKEFSSQFIGELVNFISLLVLRIRNEYPHYLTEIPTVLIYVTLVWIILLHINELLEIIF